MAHSSSSNDGTDSTDCSSESNLSLSVGYFPCEDTSYEKTISREDVSSKGPSIFVPPIQGTWRTESTGRLLRRQDQIQDDPKQFCKLSITLAWDIDVGSNNSDSIVNWDINGVNWWVDKYPEENTQLTLSKLDGLVQKLEKLLENQKDDDDGSVFPESAQEEDFQLFSSSPPDRAQVSHQEHDTCQDLPNPCQHRGTMQFPQIPLRLQEHELTEVSTQMPHRQKGNRPGWGWGYQFGTHGVLLPALKQSHTPLVSDRPGEGGRRLTARKGVRVELKGKHRGAMKGKRG